MYHKILLLDVLNCLVSSVEMSCQAKLRKHYEVMGAPIVHKDRTRVLVPCSILHVYFFQLIYFEALCGLVLYFKRYFLFSFTGSQQSQSNLNLQVSLV